MAEAYLVDAVRTPVGRRGGSIAAMHPADLGAHVLTNLVARTEIDFDGSITWDGQAVPTMQNLDTRFTQVAQQEDQDEIHVAPNRLVKYDTVAKVLADASRIGVKKIGFTGEEQYMQ